MWNQRGRTPQNTQVALVQGGLGAERDVSLVTGKAFAKALDELGYPYHIIDAREDLPQQLDQSRPDVVLLALHGKYGEDGTVQGLCEYLKIPYSSSGVLASALCMDKYFSKQIYQQNGLPTADFEWIDTRHLSPEQIQTQLEFPLVTKPAREGSSVGISICNNQEELKKGVEAAAPYDYQVLVEKYIDGTELTVPILNGKVLTPIEIVPKTNFYDYTRKYTAGATDYYLPARLPDKVIERCREIALRAWDVCRVRSYCRVDFRIDQQHQPYLMEVNTQPGCTPTSLLPKSAAHDGISFAQVVDTLVQQAGLDYAGLR